MLHEKNICKAALLSRGAGCTALLGIASVHKLCKSLCSKAILRLTKKRWQIGKLCPFQTSKCRLRGTAGSFQLPLQYFPVSPLELRSPAVIFHSQNSNYTMVTLEKPGCFQELFSAKVQDNIFFSDNAKYLLQVPLKPGLCCLYYQSVTEECSAHQLVGVSQ